MNDKILVIGGCGFVGTEVVRLLKQQDANVTVLDNMMVGEPPVNTKFILSDIRDAYSMGKIIPEYDVIVHLAGIVGVPACSVEEQFAFDVNVVGTQNVVRSMGSDSRIIFTSSTSSYGRKVNEIVTEESKLEPLTNYGLHKLYNETEIRRRASQYIIFRPATAFGASARIRLDVLPNTLTFEALTTKKIKVFEPHVIRPFIHVQDFARVIVHAINGNMPWNNIYNMGDPSLTMEKIDLARVIGKLTNADVQLMEGSDPDKRNYDVSFDKLMATKFEFLPNAIKRAVLQLENRIHYLQEYQAECNTPSHVKEYLRKYGSYS